MIKIIIGVVLLIAPYIGFGGLLGGALPTLLGLGLIIWGVVGRTKNTSQSKFGEGFKYSFAAGKTGIAISPEMGVVKLKEKSKVKEYPLNMIRSWESNLQTGGMAVHGGSSLVGASNVGAANLGQSIANRRASGLFVYTKDIENTVWRVEMFSKNDQAKWMEILQQTINET